MMERLKPPQGLQIKQYYENRRSTRNVYRAFRPSYGPYNRPTKSTIRSTISKFENFHYWMIRDLIDRIQRVVNET